MIDGDTVVGSGRCLDNHITRVYKSIEHCK